MKILVLDTETTDLISNSVIALEKQPHVIEFYGEVIDLSKKGKVLASHECLCNPGFRISDEITRITSITNDDLEGKEPFSKHLPVIISKLFRKADAVAAHNLKFDKGILDIAAKRAGIKIPWPPVQICTVEATEWLKGHRMKLSDLHVHLFEESFKDAHRARHDVQALSRCIVELKKREVI